MATCYDCANQIYKKEKLLGFVTDIPYCGAGVTNAIGDLHRKDGVCQLFKQKKKEEL